MNLDDLVKISRSILDFKQDQKAYQCFPASEADLKALAQFVVKYKQDLQDAPTVYLMSTINNSALNLVWMSRPSIKHQYKAVLFNIEEVTK